MHSSWRDFAARLRGISPTLDDVAAAAADNDSDDDDDDDGCISLSMTTLHCPLITSTRGHLNVRVRYNTIKICTSKLRDKLAAY